jgi:GcrA cell cycle regulator
MSFWTEERIETLTKLWLDGVSGEAVAREIGDGCTRNAVIGKANRLGLAAHQRSNEGSASAAMLRRVEKRKRQEAASVTGFGVNKIQAARSTAPQVFQSTPPKAEATRKSTPVPEKRQGVLFEELPANGCKFAINDAPKGKPHLFCGAPRIDGSSWCIEHNARCYGRPWPPKPFVLKPRIAA